MGVNWEQQVARFSFETFRFVEHRNRTVSTFYLHCITRLCESSFCRSLRQVWTQHNPMTSCTMASKTLICNSEGLINHHLTVFKCILWHMHQNCTTAGRKRRAVQSAQGTSVSNIATVTSGAIITKVDGKSSQLFERYCLNMHKAGFLQDLNLSLTFDKNHGIKCCMHCKKINKKSSSVFLFCFPIQLSKHLKTSRLIYLRFKMNKS